METNTNMFLSHTVLSRVFPSTPGTAVSLPNLSLLPNFLLSSSSFVSQVHSVVFPWQCGRPGPDEQLLYRLRHTHQLQHLFL